MSDERDLYRPFLLGDHFVPGIWKFFLPSQVLQLSFPKERHSTCSHCPQVVSDSYDRVYRCCSYHPRVVNFLLGFSLRSSLARRSLIYLRDIGNLLPEGYDTSPLQWYDYLADTGSERGFGSAERVRCPMLDTDSGHCRIYAFRNSVCATFYCRNDHGGVGAKFWEELQALVDSIETRLCYWAMDRLGFDVDRYLERFDALASRVKEVSDPKTRAWKKDVLRYLWGRWYGKEFLFYQKTADLIARNRDRLWEIALRQQHREAEKFHRALVRSVPRSLKNEVDEEDWEEGEAMSLEELLRDVLRSHERLWVLPERLRLAPSAVILSNARETEEDRHFRRWSFKIVSSTQKDKVVYLKSVEAKGLLLFSRPRRLDAKLYWQLSRLGISDGVDFLTRFFRQRFLVKV